MNEDSKEITLSLLRSDEYAKAQSIHIPYPSIKGEPLTDYILNHAKKASKDIYYPHSSPFDNTLTDLIVVPGQKFDRHMNRKGRGGGYYDKFLSMCNANSIKVGICFQHQLYSNITDEMKPHDIKMDIIITEKEVIRKKDCDLSQPFGLPWWTVW